MSAVEFIQLFEKLPITEQEQVRAYFDRKEPAANPDGVRRMDLNKAVKIGEGMFDRHPELFRKLSPVEGWKVEQPEFLNWEIVTALHLQSLERWGGMDGVRDRAGLESAMGAAENVFFYGGGDLYDIAAAYAYHLAQSQGFLDGNKRTAVACAGVFLEGNGCVDHSIDLELYDAMIAIADRRMDKVGLAGVFRRLYPTS